MPLRILKNTSPAKLIVFSAIAAVALFGLIIIDSLILPIMYEYLPKLHDLHKEKPYVVETSVLVLGMAYSLFALSKVSVLEGVVQKFISRFGTVYRVIKHAEFAPDTGIEVLDSSDRVLAATELLTVLAERKTSSSVIGEHYSNLYPEKLSRLFRELIEKSKATRTVAAADISEWATYSSQPMGPAMVYVTPSFEGETHKGSVVVIRSTEDIKSTENQLIFFQMHYQILFESVPLGVAIYRSSIAPDGGIDGYLISHNATYSKLLEGLPMPINEPCSVVWPNLMRLDKVREAISKANSTGEKVRLELFSPALGKHLDIIFAALPAAKLLVLVSDQTEPRLNEQKVLQLNDQLRRNLAGQAEYVSSVLEDIQQFNQAMADVVENNLEQLRDIGARLPNSEATALADISAGLYQSLSQMLRYHNVVNLPFAETALVQPAELLTRLLEPLSNRFPDIAFEIGELPGVVANREVLTSILEQLMVSLAGLPVLTAPGRIDVGSLENFVTTSITVSGRGFDTAPLFVEIPTERQQLDWTFTSDLDLAAARRMVNKHGGELFIGPTADGLGVELSFSVGSPPA